MPELTVNATAEPEREPTSFTRFVEELEKDPVERGALEEARARLRRLRQELGQGEERDG